MENIHISFKPEEVINIAGIALTNSVFTALIVMPIIIVLLIIASKRIQSFRPSSLQIAIEIIYEGLYDIAHNILGTDGIKKYFGFVFTFFVFILVTNLAGLLPIVPSLVIHKSEDESHLEEAKEEVDHEETSEELNPTCFVNGSCVLTTEGLKKNEHYSPILRASTADLSAVLTLALLSIIVTNIAGFKANGGRYFKKYISFDSPINFIVGIFEIISEIGKIISFAFRLFGNIFAGEVLLAVITGISYGLATLPFLGFEVFVAFIQAFVFFILTTVFISLARESHH